MLESDKVEKLLERASIEVAPLAFMRGRTLNDSFIILDEAQNSTAEQMKMVLTRQGFNSKMVVTGDITQIDLPNGRRSGLLDAVEILKGVEGISFVQFDERDVVRHSLVQRIVRAYEKYNEGVSGRQLSLKLSDGIPRGLADRLLSRTRRHPLRPRPERHKMKSDPLITYRRKPATLDAESLQSFAELLRDRVARGREFHCRITNDAELQSLNAQFLRQRLPDRRSVSFHCFRRTAPTAASLGDIAISLQRARAQARDWRHSTEDEIRILMLHGVLHLLGMDHESDSGQMKRTETTLAQKTRPPGRPDRARREMILAAPPRSARAGDAVYHHPDALPRRHAPAHARPAVAAVFQIGPGTAPEPPLRGRRADVLACGSTPVWCSSA